MTNQLNGIVTQLTKLFSKHSTMDAKANSPRVVIILVIMYNFHVPFFGLHLYSGFLKASF
jgi:hypothetical protein